MRILIILIMMISMVGMSQTNWDDLAIEIIRGYEGFRSETYKCPAGVKTIGYGFTDKALVDKGVMSESEASDILRSEVISIGNYLIGRGIPFKDCYQLASCISLYYNIGRRGFMNSTVVARINAGDYEGAGDAFLMWNKITINGKKVESKGLTNRRRKEREIFLHNVK